MHTECLLPVLTKVLNLDKDVDVRALNTTLVALLSRAENVEDATDSCMAAGALHPEIPVASPEQLPLSKAAISWLAADLVPA